MTKEYIVISTSEDGIHVNHLSREDLLARLAENYYGDVEFKNSISETDPNYWGTKLLIIKGDIVVPEAVKVVTQFKV